jgi:Protein of unknown function (DUF2809)
MKFNRNYFLMTTGLLIVEIIIALYVRDTIVRPYIGDLLVVVLIYCGIKSFFKWPVTKTAFGVLLFSYIVELFQYFKVIELLGVEHCQLARVIIGVSFAWLDIAAYTAGIIVVLLVEKSASGKRKGR